jgi:Carboxypeptidase regulatory-like domain/TonB dependent receptor-like, beta-barrel
MKRIGVYVLIAFALPAASAWAQATTAQISGSVKDQSGALLPGAEITVTQTATGAKRTAVTNETGNYGLASLPLGPYVLEAGLPGFKTYVQSGIVLQVGDNLAINIALEIGQVTEQVEVQANAALIETHSTSIGTIVDNQRVAELPLNGRNATELIFLAGMANVGGSGFLNSVRNYPTVMISVAGGIANWTAYNFDGVAHNDAYNSLNLPLPFPDALQEFKVESSALPAQYGVHASATVNVVTKSGTNELHGNLFEFVRNGIFNARDFFAPKRDTLKRNQFGGVIGGAIVKNKLFFFGGYQGTIQRSEPTQNIAWVPTPAMLTGDFSAFASPPCQPSQRTLSAAQGFVNNSISPTLFSPAALKVVARLPQTNDPCGKVNFGLKSNQSEHMEVARLDWQASDKHSIFGRFFVTNLTIPTTFDPSNALTLSRNGQADRVYALSIGSTYLISSNIVSAFHVGANRQEIPKVTDRFATWPELGVNAPFNPDTEPRFAISGGNGFNIGGGNAIINGDFGGPNPNVSEDISWVKGSHQFGFGANYIHTALNYKSGINATGLMTFNGSITGLGLADFLLGKPITWAQGNVQSYLYNRQEYLGAYLQDSWKATQRLTINYGLRWEPFFAFKNKHGWFNHFDMDLFNQNVHSTVYTNAPAGLIFPGDPQWTWGKKSIAYNRWGVFTPRLGLAWDPTGDGKMSIRASAGIFTDRGALYSMSAMAQDAPFGSVISIPNPKLEDPWAGYPGGNPLPIYLTKDINFPAFASYVTYNPHWHPTTVNQFSLSVQRQFGKDWLMTVNYVGNTISHLINAQEINPARFLGTDPCTLNTVNGPMFYPVCSTTANTNQRRALYMRNPALGQYYGIVATSHDDGTGNYNGMYVQIQKRMSRGTTVLANYTWSHCISDLWNGNPGNNGVSSVTPGDRRVDRGGCDDAGAQSTDQRHVFNLSAVAQVPKFSNKVLRSVASDWQFSPILKVKSGPYITVSLGTDNLLNGEGGGNQRPSLVPGVSPYFDKKSVDGWLNPKAFAVPPLGTPGNVGRNTVQAPGMIQLDLSISRTFPITEGKSIQLRGEAFNLPNHLNPGLPTGALNQGTFGKIQNDISGTSGLSSGDPRILQFALKYVF